MPVQHCTTIEISQFFPSKTRVSRVSDAVEFRHASITVPQITSEDKVIHAITKLKSELASTPTPNKHDQLEAVSNLRNIFSKYSKSMEPPNNPTKNKEIGNDSPKVPIIEAAPSPRVPVAKLAPPSNSNKNQCAKRLSNLKDVMISSPIALKKTKENLIKSSPIATRTRSQVHFKPNLKSIDTPVAERTGSKFTMNTKKSEKC